MSKRKEVQKMLWCEITYQQFKIQIKQSETERDEEGRYKQRMYKDSRRITLDNK